MPLSSEEISESLEKILRLIYNSETFERVDDALFDGLISQIRIDFDVTDVLLKTADEIMKSSDSIKIPALAIHLKLINKVLAENIIFVGRNTIYDFVKFCWNFVDNSANLLLLSAILGTFLNFERLSYEYSIREDVIKFASSLLNSESTSIFIRRQCSKYLNKVLSKDYRPELATSLVDLCCKSDFLFDSLAELLVCLVHKLSDASKLMLMECAEHKTTMNQNFRDLIVQIALQDERYRNLVKSNWESENLRSSVIDQLITNGFKELIPLVYYPGQQEFSRALNCLPLLPKKERVTFFYRWSDLLGDSNRCKENDVVRFINMLDTDFKNSDELFKSISSRFLREPLLFLKFLGVFSNLDSAKEQEVTKYILEGLDSLEWNIKDNAIILTHAILRHSGQLGESIIDKVLQRMDDENYFVRINAIYLIRDVPTKSEKFLEKFYLSVKNDPDSEPRLQALYSICKNMEPITEYHRKALEIALIDCDDDVKELAFDRIKKISKNTNDNSDQAEINREWAQGLLKKHLQDGTDRFRFISTSTCSDVDNIIEEILAVLSGSDVEHVKDCY